MWNPQKKFGCLYLLASAKDWDPGSSLHMSTNHCMIQVDCATYICFILTVPVPNLLYNTPGSSLSCLMSEGLEWHPSLARLSSRCWVSLTASVEVRFLVCYWEAWWGDGGRWHRSAIVFSHSPILPQESNQVAWIGYAEFIVCLTAAFEELPF